eukprot:GHRR01018355.1.p1 GENE.GHRR01018355.1~~GHRR01018355.1.p1  ORF type:complete len:260 (+),score=67.94 GHRR01018355.1:230-1009(+)
MALLTRPLCSGQHRVACCGPRPAQCSSALYSSRTLRAPKHCRLLTQGYNFEGSANDNGDNLASEFAAHLNQLSLKAPLQHRRPSPLDPPTAAVAAQLDALQINDWPEPDAGVQTALAFAKPYECEQLLTAAPQHAEGPLGVGISVLPLPEDNNASKESLVRSWSAQEEWLTPQQFVAQLHSAPYHVLLGCDSWRACSSMVSTCCGSELYNTGQITKQSRLFGSVLCPANLLLCCQQPGTPPCVHILGTCRAVITMKVTL